VILFQPANEILFIFYGQNGQKEISKLHEAGFKIIV